MTKQVILFILGLALFACADAQDVGKTYYLKSSGKRVSTKDSADYWMIVKTPDTAGKYPYKVYEYGNDGKLRLETNTYTDDLNLKYQGRYTAFFPNGKTKMAGVYEDGYPKGRQMQFYPNGNLYCIISYDGFGGQFFQECRDSTGKVLTTNGYGTWRQFDDNFSTVVAEGEMLNGLQEGEWRFKKSPSEKFVLTFKAGREIASPEEKQQNQPARDVYTSADKPPVFPGGNEQFIEYLQKNVTYPESATQRRDHGQMVLSFVVEKDGSLSDVKIFRSISQAIDDEVFRVLKHSPKWKPGIKDGQPVKVLLSIPINFSLN